MFLPFLKVKENRIRQACEGNGDDRRTEKPLDAARGMLQERAGGPAGQARRCGREMDMVSP
jgi:hypothetical protein